MVKKYFSAILIIILFVLLYADFSGCKNEWLPPTNPQDSTVLAGADTAGFRNGVGKVARFNRPFGITVDASGNLYIADQGNFLIRKIDIDTVVTTFAGTVGTHGFANGMDTLASFNKPFGVAADNLGNVYVADAGNNVIRMITPAGLVSTFAGTGVAGGTDGIDTATFNSPLGVAVDKSGNVYVADYGNDMIRKISPAGLVSTVAGKQGAPGNLDGLDTAARFNLPESVAVDDAGNIYVADNGNNSIRKITPAGQVTTLAGSGKAGKADGTTTSASFNSPFGIAVDAAGNVYVADSGNHLIRKISPAGDVTTFAGSGVKGAGNGNGISASFNTPAGIIVDVAGNIFISDENNNIIRKITAAGVVTTLSNKQIKVIKLK